MTRRVFVSDIHMNAGWSLYDPRSQYDWLDADASMKFAGFLRYLEKASGPERVDEVILLGDIFDTWVYPNLVPRDLSPTGGPPNYSQVAAANQLVIDSLSSLINAKGADKVHFIRGNHDISITNDFLSGAFEIPLKEEYDSSDGIHAEHGHRFVIFNAPDPDQKVPLPIGHYLSRLGATIAQVEPTFSQTECLFDAIKHLVEGDPLIDIAINAVTDKAIAVGAIRDNDNEEFLDDKGEPITLSEIRELYKKLPERWKSFCENCEDKDIFDFVKGPITSALAELNVVRGFSAIAWNIVKQRPLKNKVIIFGHTHKARLEYIDDSPSGPVPSPNGDRKIIGIYANCGAWCDSRGIRGKVQPYSYVVTETDDESKHTVTLNYWEYNREASNPLRF